jgi:hypothetical protein
MTHIQAPYMNSHYDYDFFQIEGLEYQSGMIKPLCDRQYIRRGNLTGNFNSIGRPLTAVVWRLRRLEEELANATRG